MDEVGLDGIGCNKQPLGDLLVGMTLRQQVEDVVLAVADPPISDGPLILLESVVRLRASSEAVAHPNAQQREQDRDSSDEYLGRENPDRVALLKPLEQRGRGGDGEAIDQNRALHPRKSLLLHHDRNRTAEFQALTWNLAAQRSTSLCRPRRWRSRIS